MSFSIRQAGLSCLGTAFLLALAPAVSAQEPAAEDADPEAPRSVELAPEPGAGGPTGVGLTPAAWAAESDRSSDPLPGEFTLINYFFARATLTNQLADPSGLRGVSLGPIGIGDNVGSATAVGGDTENFYIEQRWIPVLGYSPHFVDGLATFRAQFEIDYTWGQAANQLQHNQGGGLNADQVNLQTKGLHVALHPLKVPAKLSIVFGTQALYDNPADPNITSLFDIVKTGYKLAYIGTDGTGLSVYSRLGGMWKASFIPIGVGQPDKADKGDPSSAYAYMLTGDYAYELQPGTVVGASLWHLRDDTEGTAFAYEGLVKSGPSSTGLFPYTGTPAFNLDAAKGSVTWVGAHFHHDIKFRTGDFAASGFAMLNTGHYDNANPNSERGEKLDIAGFGANLELQWKYGRTIGDVITLEGMYTTGDDDLTDDKYSGVFTLNNYGLPGAVWFNHKTLLLFPFTSTVSNYTGAVTDISNRGYGLQAGILTASRDLVPNKLNLKLGAAWAAAAVTPPDSPDSIERGRTIGIELNAELKYHLSYLMTIGLHAGYLSVGSFYNANLEVDANPWATFTTFTWYGF